MESEYTLSLLNLFVCMFGGYVCICRMAKMSASETKLIIRWQYMLWFGLFSASGISWTYDQPATWIQLLMSGSIVTHLLLGLAAWRHGAPAYTMVGHQ